jgi:hypothetical protein
MGALDLVGNRLSRRGGRIGIRHLKYRGDAAEHRATRAGFEILLVGETGLTEMHMAVDHARQQMQAAAIDQLAGRGARKVPDRRELAGMNTKIPRTLAVVVDHGAALEDQVVGFSHSGPALSGT